MAFLLAAPITQLFVYVSIEKGKENFGIAIGAFVIAFLNVRKACWAVEDHWKASFLNMSVKGSTNMP